MTSVTEAAREGIASVVGKWGNVLDEELDNDPFRRDPEWLARVIPVFDAINAYFSTEVRGFENLPDGPFLLVGNHSGGLQTVDSIGVWAQWLRTRGLDAPIYTLAHNFYFSVPGLRDLIRRLGVLPADAGHTRQALQAGAPVIVFPGGDYELFRPWRERNTVDFGGRQGFIRMARSEGVPIVPMVTHGGHESTFVLTRGMNLAERVGLHRVKIKVVPLMWNVPFGLMPASTPGVVLPAKTTVDLGEPIEIDDSPDEVWYDKIVGSMQSTMDRLAGERPRPILSRFTELLPRLPGLSR